MADTHPEHTSHPSAFESRGDSLMEQFLRLSEFEQALLTLLAIACEPAHTTLLIHCLKLLELKNPRGNQPTVANINHYFTKFASMDLLTKEKQCALEIAERLCKKAVHDGVFGPWSEAIRAEAPVSWYYGKWTTRCWRAMRECRIAIYTMDFEAIDEATAFLSSQCAQLIGPPPAAVRVVCGPFDGPWFRALPASFQFYLMNSVLAWGQASLTTWPELLEFLGGEGGLDHLNTDERIPFQRLYFNELLLRARFEEAQQQIDAAPEAFKGTGAEGSLCFLRHDTPADLNAFDIDLAFLSKYNPNGPVAIFGIDGLFSVLARIAAVKDKDWGDSATAITTALTLFENVRENRCYGWLAAVIDAQLNSTQHQITLPDTPIDALELIFAALCQYWLNNAIELDVEEEIVTFFHRAIDQEFQLLAAILGEILMETRPDSEEAAQAAELRKHLNIRPLLPLITPEEPWRRSLAALISATGTEEQESNIRMAWMVSFLDGKIQINPREQKVLANGSWSKGRPTSPARLYQGSHFPWLSPHDRRITATIVKQHNPATNSTTCQFDMDKAIVAMVGHPHLFLADSPNTPVEFVEGEPELLVEEQGDNLHLCFAQPITGEAINFYKETPTRIKVIRINEKHRKIAQITGSEGITVPKAASEEVLTAIGNISSFMTVHSAIAADRSRQTGVTFVDADSTIYIHLVPYGTGFRLEMFVKPFAEGGHYLKPGQGVENIMAEVGGTRLQTRRDLAREEQNAREVEEMCPVLDLSVDMEQENEREWHLNDPDDCLQALMELQAIRDKVIIEWPEGERLSISQQVGAENLNLKIRTNRQNWFAMSGVIEVDQGRVIELKDLLSRMKPGGSRFVEIGDGQFVALTQEFRKRLDDLSLFSEKSDTNELMIHPLAALQLEKLTERSHTEVDSGWKEQLRRIADARNFAPVVPSTLRAELRQYQREGFEWLARLAHWGVGGCLADDMGLGKTIQSLAVILEMASRGPSLVIAPTSVSTNWQTEVERFAPTINIVSLGAKDRKKDVEDLGKFDLLITTYTLLQQESELLSLVQWQAVILDEAQAIKNSATKRSHAAMSLQAKFKLITTGTPIENHLGELWNLFHFINPGLLGSLSHFNEHFAVPIERYGDREARLRLKNLIRPFMLRRIKSEVLEELPSRTEVTLNVDMSLEETNFYEALRQNAIDMLESNREKKGRHLQILTEIMRLRQACCNPRLIDADSSIESSKLAVFAEVVGELLESNHKALIFSQFIGHLSIIRKYLDEKKIHYQYLDGATPTRQRKIRVDAFQAGEGDLFLISLKAGGLGLNLTAADYVIHMDPWWNPAIEDQASDRAYRIGQTRPVTIYRLVCRNSIEEKIIKLHQEKRDLASSLLEGTDMSAKMSSDDLLELIKGR